MPIPPAKQAWWAFSSLAVIRPSLPVSPVEQQAVLAALQAATKPVRVIGLTSEYRVTPERAAALVRTGEYYGRMRHGRVARLRQLAEKPAVRQDGYRTTGGAPVVPVERSWIWRMCGKPGRRRA